MLMIYDDDGDDDDDHHHHDHEEEGEEEEEDDEEQVTMSHVTQLKQKLLEFCLDDSSKHDSAKVISIASKTKFLFEEISSIQMSHIMTSLQHLATPLPVRLS